MKPAVLSPLLRELARTPLPGAVAMITAPLAYQLARTTGDVRATATLMLVAGSALLALAFDDPAQRTLDSCPTARSARRGARGALVAAAVGAGWVGVVSIANWRGAELGPVAVRLPEMAAAAAVASALAAIGMRARARTPGLSAAMATVLAMSTSTGMSFASRRFDWLPQLANTTHARRWWLVASIGALAAVWFGRDPAARSLGAVATSR